MIREATHADIAACLDMCRAFFSESGFEAEATFDDESMTTTLRNLVDSADGVVFVNNDLSAIAAAIAYPYYFNLATKTAQEMFWWVHPDRRGGIVGMRLLSALEKWARAIGCGTLSMICLPSLDKSPAERMYIRAGYRASERAYIKRL